MLIEQYPERPSVSVHPPQPAEGSIDSITLTRLATMPGVASTRLHRVVGVLDPSSNDASVVASELTHLAEETTLNVAVSLFLAPQGSLSSASALSDILAGHCAQRQGRLVEFLEAVESRSAQRHDDLVSLATYAHVRSPADFIMCVRRRETMEDLSNGQLLVRRLHLSVLPAFLIDSTVIRGRITVDSVRVRLVAKRK
jgi:hypothetical protein